MSTGTLFAIGAVVFVMGGLGVVLQVMSVWQDWRLREASDDEEEHLRERAERRTKRPDSRAPMA